MSAHKTATAAFRQMEVIVARIGRELDKEYARDPDGEFLSPEYEDLRSLSASLVELIDRYSHLTDSVYEG